MLGVAGEDPGSLGTDAGRRLFTVYLVVLLNLVMGLYELLRVKGQLKSTHVCH